MSGIYVKDLMTPSPTIVSPEMSVRDAARMMAGIDSGFLPVSQDEYKPVGVITDRDIAMRVVAEGRNPLKTTVGECMTPRVYACNEGDTLEDAAEKMRSFKVSRLVVRNRVGKITGVLSFGGMLRREAAPEDITKIVRHALSAEAV